MMGKILRVARREYLEVVKTRMFLMGILMTPILMAVVLYFGQQAGRDARGPLPPRKVAVLDRSGQLGAEIQAVVGAHNTGSPQRQIALEPLEAAEDFQNVLEDRKAAIRQRRLDALVVIDPDAVDGPGRMHVYTSGASMAALDLGSSLESLVNRAVVDLRYKSHNLSPELLAQLRRNVPAEQIDVGLEQDRERRRAGPDILRLMVPFFFMFMMFFGIVGSGQQLLGSIIEEKSSRIVEVLLSALSPFELMAGKIVGLAGTSLTVLGLWAAAAVVAARWKGLDVSVPPAILPYFIVYYVLGFLLFSSLLAAIGSVCNTLKETQGLMMPLTLLLVLPMIGWYGISQHPDGASARLLSFVPPLTPMVMILRLSSSPDLSVLEVAASIVVLGASVPAAMWAAAKVFRTGILLYGKRPGVAEVWRWVWQG